MNSLNQNSVASSPQVPLSELENARGQVNDHDSVNGINLSPDQLPLLITGIAGVSGYNAFYHFRKKYGDQVYGLRTVKNWPLSGDQIIGCDVEDQEHFKSLIDQFGIRTILNCGGSCALKACELDPEMAHRVNVEGIRSLLSAAKETDIQVMHLSIDLVFSGKGDGNHIETDEPDPVTVYGKTMVAAERLVLDSGVHSCIMRISLPMGISFNGHAGAIDWIQSRFIKQMPATLYFDEVRTPTFVECLNETIEEVLSRKFTGLFHAGGPTKLSLYQIAQIVNRVGGYDPDLLMGCPRIDAGPIPPRAGNVTMDSSKLANALGRQPFLSWPLRNSQMPDSRTWHYDRDDSFSHSNDLSNSMEAIKNELYLRPNDPETA